MIGHDTRGLTEFVDKELPACQMLAYHFFINFCAKVQPKDLVIKIGAFQVWEQRYT